MRVRSFMHSEHLPCTKFGTAPKGRVIQRVLSYIRNILAFAPIVFGGLRQVILGIDSRRVETIDSRLSYTPISIGNNYYLNLNVKIASGNNYQKYNCFQTTETRGNNRKQSLESSLDNATLRLVEWIIFPSHR